MIGTNTCLHGRDVPRDLPGADDLYPGTDDDWMSRGNTAIVGPDGEVIAGPLLEESGMLIATLDLDELTWRAASSTRSATTRGRTSSSSPSSTRTPTERHSDCGHQATHRNRDGRRRLLTLPPTD